MKFSFMEAKSAIPAQFCVAPQYAERIVRWAKGVIGMSICPGSHDYEGRSGPRERSLEADLQVIRAGGYGIVVPLLETWELDFLHVAGKGEGVAAHGKSWWHLPVKDCRPLEYPGDGFVDARIDRWSLPCTLLLRM
jgi:hypothetical protein